MAGGHHRVDPAPDQEVTLDDHLPGGHRADQVVQDPVGDLLVEGALDLMGGGGYTPNKAVGEFENLRQQYLASS